MSAAISSAAPISAAGTHTRAGSEPTARRTRCGATSPTKPIEPATATAAPTPSATPITTVSRVRSMSTPSEAAASSPSVSARKARALSASSSQLAAKNGAAIDEVLDAAVLERAEQPERDLERGVGRWARG